MFKDLNEFIKETAGCDTCSKVLQIYLDLQGEDSGGATPIWRVLKDFKIPVEEWKEVVKHIKCNKCSVNLELGSYVINDFEILCEDTAELVVDILNEEIKECQYCNADIIHYTQMYEDPADLKTGFDLMRSKLDIPSEIYDEVASGLCCSCGEKLNEDDPYVTRQDLDRWYEDEIADSIVKTFNIPRETASDFVEHLMRYPMIGLKHDVGQHILNSIILKEVAGIKTIDSGEILYRARSRNIIKRRVPYIFAEMGAPPHELSEHGRYNPVGVPVLYLADSPYTSIKEIDLRDGQNDVAEIAKFITISDICIWDVRGLDIKDFISLPSLNSGVISKEYLFPNFLAQCCSIAGLNGISYESTKNRSGYNIALFNYCLDKTLIIDSVEQGVKAKGFSYRKVTPKHLKTFFFGKKMGK